MEIDPPFQIFKKNFATKFSSAIKVLVPSNKDFKIDLIMPKDLETLFYNEDFYQIFNTGQLKLSFLETISIQRYDLKDTYGILFITSNQEAEILKIIDFLNEFVKVHSSTRVKVHFLVWPQQTSLTASIIQNKASPSLQALFGEQVKIQNFNFDFYPFEEDLFSLEYSPCFREILLTNETIGINLSAEAIFKLQILYGTFSNIFFWGKSAERTLSIFQSIENENKTMSFPPSTLYPNLVVIDRTVDLISAFLSQYAYIGLLDEVFGINKAAIRIPKSALDPENKTEDLTYYPIQNDREILPKLLNEYFNDCLEIIRTETMKLQDNKKLIEMPDVEKAREVNLNIMKGKSIAFHFRLITKINSYSERAPQVEFNMIVDSILENDPKSFDSMIEYIQVSDSVERCYRLAFLYNLSFGGYNDAQYQKLTKEFVDSFGIEALVNFAIYEQAGLITNVKAPNPNMSLIDAQNYRKYRVILKREDEDIKVRNKAQLTGPDYSYHRMFNYKMPTMIQKFHDFWALKDPNSPIKEWSRTEKDESAPVVPHSNSLSLDRAIQSDKPAAKEPGLRGIQSINLTKQPFGEERSGIVKKFDLQKERERRELLNSGDIVLFVVGGLTFNEVAAIRKVSAQINRNIVICTTSIIKADSLFAKI